MVKIVLFTIISGIICFYLKNNNKDFFPLALLASSILLSIEIISYLSETIIIIKEIISMGNIEEDTLKIILKITGIGIVVEFGASMLNDLGVNSLSDKLILVGKIMILLTSIPILYSLLMIIRNLLKI